MDSLNEAVKRGDIETVKNLVEYIPDFYLALFTAFDNNQIDIAIYLIEKIDNEDIDIIEDEVLSVIDYGYNTKLVKSYLSRNLSTNGYLDLMKGLSVNGYLESIKILMENCNPDLIDVLACFGIGEATYGGYLDVILFLLPFRDEKKREYEVDEIIKNIITFIEFPPRINFRVERDDRIDMYRQILKYFMNIYIYFKQNVEIYYTVDNGYIISLELLTKDKKDINEMSFRIVNIVNPFVGEKMYRYKSPYREYKLAHYITGVINLFRVLEDAESYLNWIDDLSHYQNNVTDLPLTNNYRKSKIESSGKKLEIFKWAWMFHNAVNTRINKPYIDWETAVDMFYNNTEVCSQNCDKVDD